MKKQLANKGRRAIGTDSDIERDLATKSGVTGGSWKPEIGDRIIGTILSMKREDSRFKENQLTLVISTEEGAKTVWANFSLEQALFAERVNEGDIIGIERKEDSSFGRGRPMKTFAVARKGGKGKNPHPALTEATATAKKNPKRGKRR